MGTATNENFDKLSKVKGRVQKLLAQAEDQAGTAEGDAFYRKAFEMMAAYGFEQCDLDTPTADDEVISREFTFAGSYTDMQAQLLGYLVAALHCSSFRMGKRKSTKVYSAMVFGVRRHVERIDMLFSLLNPQMAAGARRVYGDRFRGVSTVVARRSYMHGFAATVFERLNAAEESVAAEEGRYALALIDDGSKAESARDAFAEKHGLWLGSATSKRSMDVGSFHQGRSDGTGTDLGQTRVRARPALPV